MQPITAYTQSNDLLRLLLQGSPGSGKTVVACQFPGAYVIDVDVNLGGALRFLKERKLPLPVGFDVLDRDETGTPVPMPMRYARLDRLLREAQLNPEVQTIVIDSATTLSDVLVAETLRLQNKVQMTKQEWGFFGAYGKQLMSTFAAMRKHIVFIAHEKLEKDSQGAVVFPRKVAWPGQVGQNIGAFFTNVWRCEVQQVPSGTKTEYKFNIRTMPDFQFELKNTLGLPPVFQFNWQQIETALKGVAA